MLSIANDVWGLYRSCTAIMRLVHNANKLSGIVAGYVAIEVACGAVNETRRIVMQPTNITALKTCHIRLNNIKVQLI